MNIASRNPLNILYSSYFIFQAILFLFSSFGASYFTILETAFFHMVTQPTRNDHIDLEISCFLAPATRVLVLSHTENVLLLPFKARKSPPKGLLEFHQETNGKRKGLSERQIPGVPRNLKHCCEGQLDSLALSTYSPL